ncbi:MAG: SCO family protein [Rhizobiaceae bacterium]|nr:SCO family protein [Rhizobiaceae bacterium]
MNNRFRSLVAAMVALSFTSGLVDLSIAHDGVVHKNLSEALKHQEETSPNTAGFPEVKGGDFELINQFGETRTSKSPDGQYQLLFFGYANCKAICSVALPSMAAAIDILDEQKVRVTPLLVTVDPERDTVNNMEVPLKALHSRMIGLTGTEEALQQAYDAFQVQKSLVYEHPEEGPIYAHGSFIYLLGPNGEFKTLMPPILAPERIAELTLEYISGKKS